MTFFGILREGSSLGIIFILVSLLNVYYAFRVASNLGQRWREFQREPLQSWQKQIIDRAAFFLGVPLGVVVHELGHAITVWLFGGQIVDAGYGFYWGYVSHTGYYSDAQLWVISIAGTIGSLLYGFVMWLIFRRIPRSSYRYFALRILRVHLIYSLIFYPIFTLVTFVGDWRTIYDFNATPMLSGITLVVHLLSIALLWWTDRLGLFEMPAFESVSAQERMADMKAQAIQSPHDERLQLRLIEAYRLSGMPYSARRALGAYLKEHPGSAEGHLQMAILQAQNKRQVPKSARDSAAQALRLGLSEPAAAGMANQLLGQYALGVGRVDEAINAFSEGLAAAKAANRPALLAQLHYQRTVAYRRKGRYDLAEADIQQAIMLARQSGQGQALTRYEAELAAIKHHGELSSGSSR